MAQQTTMEVVVPRWERFLARFPDVAVLARAKEEEVLAEWSGLGYYARARNLHRAARAVAAAGGFPRTLEGWRALPGVGPYTAAAVVSICFGVPEPVVDGNVVRVLCRLHGLRLDPKAPATAARVRSLARSLLPKARPGDHNQALMELGALVCTPRAPRCGACPLVRDCAAAAKGTPEAFPKPAARPSPTTIRLAAAIVRRDGRFLLERDREMVAGQLAPPMVRIRSGKWSANFLGRWWLRRAGREVAALERVATLRHSVLTRRYRIDLFTFEEEEPRPGRRGRLDAFRSPRRAPQIIPVSLSELSRRAHGGFLLKALAAWREHAALSRAARRARGA